MPKISVIIPIYNSEKYLRQCLDSVINQTFKDIEIICVNDGSTDSSKDILEEYAEKDKRIIIVNQKNSHAGVARNNGVKVAKGKYIHFLDSDDWIKENTYEYLYKLMLDNKDVDFMIFQADRIDINTNEVVKKRDLLEVDNQISNIKENPDFFIYCGIAPWNKLYKRQFILDNKLKYDKIISSEDRVFYMKAILVAQKIMVSHEVFIYHRINNNASLVGEIRLKNYDCHFASYKSVKKVCKNESLDIQRIIMTVALQDIFYFYRKSYGGKYAKKIRKKLHKFFRTMDSSLWDNESKKPKWWAEYIEIKNDGIKKKIKIYIKKIKKNLKEKGVIYTIRKSFTFLISKFKKICGGFKCQKSQ